MNTKIKNEFSREAGILLPVFSLPGKYGIGTFGREAYGFIDFLASAGQKLWQVLPLNPTGFGDSPYSSFSIFAGNPYFIDPGILVEKGLLKRRELNSFDFGSDPRKIDYEKLYFSRFSMLRLAMNMDNQARNADYLRFNEENAAWLNDYALFMALKKHFSMLPWYCWSDEGARLHKSSAIGKYERLLKDDVDFYKYIQYLFYTQWKNLKLYANENGVRIVGDLPIYCALDSADVWANRRNFDLDENGMPNCVAGVPPDAFSKDGQLWGNPLYDWKRLKKSGYKWWLERIENAKTLFDAVRLDHFRGFESYFAVPFGETTARNGHWVEGAGMDFINAIKHRFGDMDFIAEDLGFLTDEVHALRRESGFPGMKVLEFAFDPSGKSDYLPHNYDKNCVCYTGTHDNAPLSQYLMEVGEDERTFIAEYLGVSAKNDKALQNAILRAALASTANTSIAQMQDYLFLDEESRINTPGTSENNWQWRMKKGEASKKLAERIKKLTELYGR